MHNKLTLDIKLYETKSDGTFSLCIKFIDFDERFAYSGSENLSYTSKYGFKIISSKDKPFGGIGNESISFPCIDKVGFDLKRTFYTDGTRKSYLKSLFFALDEWANYYDGFVADSISNVKVKDTRLNITCKEKREIRHSSRDIDILNWVF